MQNLEPVRQELKPYGIGNNGFEKALKDARLHNSHIDDLKAILKKIMVKVGIRSANLPNDLEKVVLIEHIIKNFSGNTLSEIELAFDMAISGKLDCEINCYENFSCLYFSNIMNAYRTWAVQEHEFISNKREVIMIENKSKLTDQEMEDWINDWKLRIELVENVLLIPSLFYDYLDKNNRLKFSKDEKNKFLFVDAIGLRRNYLIGQMVHEGKNGKSALLLKEFDKQKKEGSFEPNEGDALINIAKKVTVFNYLNSIK